MYFGSNPRNDSNDKIWKHTAIRVIEYTGDFTMEKIVVKTSEIKQIKH